MQRHGAGGRHDLAPHCREPQPWEQHACSITATTSAVHTATTSSASVAEGVNRLSLERPQSAFLQQGPPSPSPFSNPLASLVGAIGRALPPAAISAEDAALLAGGPAPQRGGVRALYQQETMVVRKQQQQQQQQDDGVSSSVQVTTTTTSTTTTSRVVVLADTSGAASPPQCPCDVPAPSSGSLDPAAQQSQSKARLHSTATSLASLAAANASQGGPAAQQTAIPPHGVKAVCGKRAKMEDAFSVQCNFAELQMSSFSDAADFANKLPARIASQVGEQLEVQPSQPLPAAAPQQQPSPPPSSPPVSVPLSPCAAAATAAAALSQQAPPESEPSVSGGSSSASASAVSDSSSDAASSSASCCDTLHFFAVYDGHGGVEAAQHCANRLHFHLWTAIAALVGAAVHTQDAFCVANRTQGPDGTTTTASVQCEAEWTLCASPGPPGGGAGGGCPDGPERSQDTIVASPADLAALRAGLGAGEGSGTAGSSLRGQQAVERLFSSSEVAAGAAAPQPPHGGAGEGAAAAGDGGDAASNHSEGNGGGSAAAAGAGRSESAATGSGVCMSDALEQALRSAFLKTDEEFAEDGSSAMVGSTAVVALVGTKKMWIANCGDSRAVLCRGGRAIQVTDDHKPEREDEAERVEKAGGQVLYWNGHRVMGVLAMSRAIGDHGLRPYVIPEPEITVLSRVPDDDFLLMASDGLWDVMSNQEAITLAMRCLQRSYDKGTSRKAAVRVAATVLTRAAVDRGSKDNITVVIVDLKAPQGASDGGAAQQGGAGGCGGEGDAATVVGDSAASAAAEGACGCGGQEERAGPVGAVAVAADGEVGASSSLALRDTLVAPPGALEAAAARAARVLLDGGAAADA